MVIENWIPWIDGEFHTMSFLGTRYVLLPLGSLRYDPDGPEAEPLVDGLRHQSNFGRPVADFGTPSMNRKGEHSSPRSATVSGNFTRFHRDLAYTPGVRSRRLIDLTRQDNPVEYENAIFGSMQNLMNIREASLPLRLQELCEPDGVSD
nr:hypothetical protein [Auritidibacter ignavus]